MRESTAKIIPAPRRGSIRARTGGTGVLVGRVGLALGAGAAVAALPGRAHAHELGEWVHEGGHRVMASLGRQLGGLVENLLDALWSQMLGHGSASGGHACAGLALWDLAALLLIAALVFAVVRVRNQTAAKRLDVARRMVEQGMEPPGDLLGDSRAGDLRRGVVLVFAGLGLLVASWTGAGVEGSHAPPSAAGLIPGFIGLGYLVSHWLARMSAARPASRGASATGDPAGARWSAEAIAARARSLDLDGDVGEAPLGRGGTTR